MEKKVAKKNSKKTTSAKLNNKSNVKTTTKKNKRKKKRSKAFTLIELLAVIIILGILMIIAVPSVTNYINDSRKSSYIDTVFSLIDGARNMVNHGEFGAYDTSVTYYLPAECVKTENSLKSPFGEFGESYVVFTYNGKGYDYYYTGLDDSGHGILLTSRELLSEDSILTDVKNIDSDIAVGDRERIVTFSYPECNGTKSEKVAVNTILDNSSASISLERLNLTDSNLARLPFDDYILSSNVTGASTKKSRDEFEKISFIKGNVVPDDAIQSWDVSLEKDGRIMAWYTDVDNNGLYELTVGGRRKIYANPNCSNLFRNFRNVKVFDFQNYDTSKVTNMSYMFSGNGTDANSDMDVEYIYGLENFNTSKVTDMSNMFAYCSNLKSLNVSHFDTSKVTTMKYMFHGWYHGNGSLTVVDASNFDLSSVTTMYGMFSWDSKLKEVKLGKNKAIKLTDASYMFAYSYENYWDKIDVSNILFNSSLNDSQMFGNIKNNNTKIYVSSEADRDYILNSTRNKHNTSWNNDNFIIK